MKRTIWRMLNMLVVCFLFLSTQLGSTSVLMSPTCIPHCTCSREQIDCTGYYIFISSLSTTISKLQMNFRCIPISGFKGITSFVHLNSSIVYWERIEFESIINLSTVLGSGYSFLPLQPLDRSDIKMRENNLTHLDLADLLRWPNLAWLDLSMNRIKAVEGSEKELKIEVLDLSYNHIQVINEISKLEIQN